MRVRHRRTHRLLWLALAIVLPATLMAALAQRDARDEAPPQRLAPPR